MMDEMSNEPFAVPPPLPSGLTADVPMMGRPVDAPPNDGQPTGKTDRVAVASVLCGATAFIPVISQVIGFVLGVIALRRIRRAKRMGTPVRGGRLAMAGITGNGLVLLFWIALFGAFTVLRSTYTNASESLQRLTAISASHRQHVRK